MGNEVSNYAYAYQDLILNSNPVEEEKQLVANFQYNEYEPEVMEISEGSFPTISTLSARNREGKLSKSQMDLMNDYFEILSQIITIDKEHLKNEGIDIPTKETIEQTKELISLLAADNIYPNRIGSTVEEGVCLTFHYRSKALYFEVYNDGELGYIVEDKRSKSVIANEDVHSIPEGRSAIVDFFDLICNFQGV